MILGIVRDTTTLAIAFSYLQINGLGLHCAILIAVNIIVDEFNGRYCIVALIAWNSKEVINHVSLQAIGRKFGLICNLCIILVEIFGELYNRLLDKFQVAVTTDNDSEVKRLTRLDILVVYLG